MTNAIRKFWMVWGAGTRGPNSRHETKESAQAEAKRLAGQHPGMNFIVLSAVDAYRVDLPEPTQVAVSKSPTAPVAEGHIPF